MSTDDRDETITDRAAIRDSDEPSERGDFPCCSGATVAALDLDAIEGRARYALEWGDSANKEMILALVAEVRRIGGELEMSQRMLATMDHWAEVAETCERKANESHARREAAEAEREALRAKVAAVEAKRDEFADLLARALPAVAALARVESLGDNNPDHADTCGSMLTPGAGYPCSCWQADLRAALATGEGE